VVWEISGAVGPVKALGGGWEVFAGEDGRLAVVRLADRRQLWRSRDTLGHVAAVGRFGRAGKGLDSVVLYTARAAVGAADGTVRFAYPPGLRPVALTSEHLLLLPGWRPPSDSAGVDSAIVLLDRRTGAVRARVPRRGCVNATPVAEDSTALYVAAMVREGSAVHLSSVLLVVSKAGGRVREVPLGRNLAAARIGVLPRDKLLFMASFQSLGAYRLPE